LTFLNARALVKKYASDTAGNLAAGVQNPSRPGCRLTSDGNFYFGLAIEISRGGNRKARQRDEGYDDPDPASAGARLATLGVVDAE
jgi:hypothetical protein